MFFQTEISKEVQFLIYLIPVILGIQISISFFYRYRKIKDISLPLNKILLAFGSFLLLIVIGPLLIQISRNFIADGFLDNLIYRLGWGIAFTSTLSVSFFIIKKEFSSIIDLKFAKILLVLNFISIVILFLAQIPSPLFVASILLVALNGFYIIRFMVVLIKRSVGKIKKKFKQFFLGAMVSLPSLLFATIVGLQILNSFLNQIVYFFGVSELLIGFIIMAFSVYQFPPFYEFEWRESLQKLFVIDTDNRECLFYHNFQDTEEPKTISENLDGNINLLFPKGIVGIENLLSTITDTQSVRIEKIKKKNSYIFLEHGKKFENLTFVLLLERDLKSANYFVKVIRNRFESFFKEILMNFEDIKVDQNRIFSSFDQILEIILKLGGD
jgi:hypothetical protein